MHADKAGRGQNPSGSLRASQPSPTKLGDSDKRVGTLSHRPDDFEESARVAVQLPADGIGNSALVRPAATHAAQVVGDLSRLGKKLRDSREPQAKKRTQSKAGIGEEGGNDRATPKRQRTEDTAVPRAPALGDEHVNLISLPALQVVSQPVRQTAIQPTIQPSPRPAPQPTAQTLVVRPEPPPTITPDLHAQIAMVDAFRMAKSITPFQPEKISELFQHLCRAQLWPLLKLEEQRVLHLMKIYGGLPSPSGVAAGVAGAGLAMAVDAPSSFSTTTTTTPPGSSSVVSLGRIATSPTNALARGAPLPNPEPIAPAGQSAPDSHASKVSEWLFPQPPNPPSPDYARDLLSSLPEGTQRLMKSPAPKIREMFQAKKFDLTTTNNLTAFTCFLVEIASHGGLPHFAEKLDDFVFDLLQHLLSSHRQYERQNKVAGNADAGKAGAVKDPAYAYLLRLMPTYPQFTRVLGSGFNRLPAAQRMHFQLSRKFNAVLELMRDRRLRSLSDLEFKKRLDDIVGNRSLPGASSRASTASTTASVPTSAPAERLEDDSDEGSDGDI